MTRARSPLRWLALPAALAAAALAPLYAAAAQAVYISPEEQKSLHDAAMQSPEPTVDAVINLYDTVLGYRMPKHFVPAFRATQPTSFSIEFVPYGEDVRENWSEMLTVQAIPAQVAAAISPRTMVENVARGVANTCPGHGLSESAEQVRIEGATTAVRQVFGCRLSRLPGGDATSEVGMIQAMRRGGDLIIVQYAVRGAPIAADSPALAEGKRAEIAALLGATALADNDDEGAQ